MDLFSSLCKEPFDGVKLTWSTFKRRVDHALTGQELAGKKESDKQMAMLMREILIAGEMATLNDIPGLEATLTTPGQQAANRLLYALLGSCTKDRPETIVAELEPTKSGVAAWVRLKHRYGATGAIPYADILRFVWKGNLEDLWRSFVTKVGQLPKVLDDGVLEALVIDGCKDCGSTALHQDLRLKAPQTWTAVKAHVDNYINTMRKDTPVPMDIDLLDKGKGKGKDDAATNSGTTFTGKCHECGKVGHKRQACPKLRSKGKGKGTSHVTCHTCGGKGHMKKVCPTKRSVNAVEDMDISEVTTHRLEATNIMVDSGAAVHVCPWEFYQGCPTTDDGERNVQLYAANGQEIPVHGERAVRLDTALGG